MLRTSVACSPCTVHERGPIKCNDIPASELKACANVEVLSIHKIACINAMEAGICLRAKVYAHHGNPCRKDGRDVARLGSEQDFLSEDSSMRPRSRLSRSKKARGKHATVRTCLG